MPRSGPRTVRRYSDEFKLTAVRLSQQPGIQVQTVAAALAIHPFMLSKWRKDARDGRLRGRAPKAPPAGPAREIAKLQQLEREYALLKEEHDLLKKPSGSVPLEGGRVRLHRDAAHRVQRDGLVSALWGHGGGLLCLAAPRSERSCGTGPAARDRDHATLSPASATLREPASTPTPPERRLAREPPACRAADARGGPLRAGGAWLSCQGHHSPPLRPASESALVDLDHASKSGVGRRYHLSAGESELALPRGGDGPVLPAGARLDADTAPHRGGHLPRPHAGGAHAPRPWRDLPQRPRLRVHGAPFCAHVARLGLLQSATVRGPSDNPHMESFFHSLKAELTRGVVFPTDRVLRAALRRYLTYYNTTRLHSGLNYVAPVAFERRAA